MVKTNIHILQDSIYSNWFVDRCLKNNTYSKNIFYCFTDSPIYLSKSEIIILPINSKSVEFVLEILNNPNEKFNLYVHYLDEIKADLINGVFSKNVKIQWVIWSEDLYQLPKLTFKKYDEYSTLFFNHNIQVKKITLKQRLGRLKMMYINGIDLNKNNKWKAIYHAIKKIDVAVTAISEEVDILQQNINPKIEWLAFAYIDVTNDLINQDSSSISKTLIQVGNSADPANNHFEVIKKLHGLNVKDNILLPLSYGNVHYKVELIKDIQKYFTLTQLILLEKLQEKDVYYENLKRVKSAIFGHNIQQAFGNIIALIYFGAKVFLKKENPLFKQFKKWGIVVFSIEKDLTKLELDNELPTHIIEKNKQNILQLFSNDKVDEYYNKLLQL